MKKIYLILIAFFPVILMHAQGCPEGQSLMEIDIRTDNYAQETSWKLKDITGNIIASVVYPDDADATLFHYEYCVPDNECIFFTMYDQYGDGICCNYGQGYYTISIDGVEMASGGTFGASVNEEFNCPEGSTCNSPIEIEQGIYTVADNLGWYIFTAPENGIYEMSTCESGACDTRLQVYEYCNMNGFDNTQIGGIYFDDNNPTCGNLAHLDAILQGGLTYYIRVSEVEDCDTPIIFELNYIGEVTGCTDPAACNYQPLATSDDGNCIYPGDPNCMDGPDLKINQDVLRSSCYVSSINVGPNDCYINEGCLNGYGNREIIRFTTRIENIGTQDFYIGSPANQPQMFTFDPCHNHWHYDGYAEYLLYDTQGHEIPIGFKYGFCVMDLTCPSGIPAQYGCSNMGITAQCADIYGSGLACQWIDVTDVPDGDYHLIVRTNYDNGPDALGRMELDYYNNWGQVCLHLDRSAADGELHIQVLEDCDVYLDCEGVEFGGAVMDCEGTCNGTSLAGDLNMNGLQNMADALNYNQSILADDISPTSCNDLNNDGVITVTDAALVNICNIYNVAHQHPDSSGFHDHCNFPRPKIINYYDSVTFTIADYDVAAGYLDIYVKNPNNRIVGYEFNMTGLDILNTENIADIESFPTEPQNAFLGHKVLSMSYVDSSLTKSDVFQPLVRVYFTNAQDEICISEIVDVVNHAYENTLTYIDEGCLTLTAMDKELNPYRVKVYPNPFHDKTTFSVYNPTGEVLNLRIHDLTGRKVFEKLNMTGSDFTFENKNLSPGVYFYELSGRERQTGKIVVN